MQITKENYELYIIDYLDGKLDSEGKQALFAFVEANPDIKEEFDLLMESSDLESDSGIEVPDFSFLKKQSLLGEELIGDELLIAKMEGDLTNEQSLYFEKVISQDKLKQKEFKLYQSTVSKPDLTIQFPNKKSLKKGGLIIQLSTFQKVSSVAAVLLMFAFFGWMNSQQEFSYQTAMKMEFNQEKTLTKLRDAHSNSDRNIKSNDAENNNLTNPIQTSEKQLAVVYTDYSDKQKEDAELINSKPAKIDEVKIVFNEFPQSVFPVFNSNTPMAALSPQIDEFKTPGRWLIEKAKNLSQVQPILKTDSLIRNKEVGNVAINLLNQTPGILATAKTDEEGNNRGFAIMSRYFSFERSY